VLREFAGLRRLLLVHGHYCNHRISRTILYFFFKSVAITTPVFLFAVHSAHSAQQLYDGWLLVCWNMLFTAAPILVYGVLEEPCSAGTLLANPALYKAAGKNRELSCANFCRTLLTSALVSCCVFEALHRYSRDSTIGIRVFSTVLYVGVFISCTAKIMCDTARWTALSYASVGVSAVALVTYLAAANYLAESPMFGVGLALAALGPAFWAVYSAGTAACVLLVCKAPAHLMGAWSAGAGSRVPVPAGGDLTQPLLDDDVDEGHISFLMG